MSFSGSIDALNEFCNGNISEVRLHNEILLKYLLLPQSDEDVARALVLD